MNRIKNKYVSPESDQIKKLSQIKSKPQLSLIKSTIVSQIESKVVTRKTADANERANDGGSYGWAFNAAV